MWVPKGSEQAWGGVAEDLDTHPLIFIHSLKGVLGQWVLTVAQLRHHGTEQLQRDGAGWSVLI